jgi:hypothetical protein
MFEFSNDLRRAEEVVGTIMLSFAFVSNEFGVAFWAM